MSPDATSGEIGPQTTTLAATLVAVEDGVPGCPVWLDRPRGGWSRCGFSAVGECPTHGTFPVTTYEQWVSPSGGSDG